MANTKQKASLGSKLGSLGFKGKLLLFVLTFALIGGVYYVYRSFAMVPSYYESAENLQITGGSLTKKGADQNKKERQLAYIQDYNRSSGQGAVQMRGNYLKFMNENKGAQFKICVYALPVNLMGGQEQYPGGMVGQIRNFSGVWQEIRIPVTGNYEVGCTPLITPSSSDYGDGAAPRARIWGGDLLVAGMYIEAIGGGSWSNGSTRSNETKRDETPANLFAYSSLLKRSDTKVHLVGRPEGAKVYKIPKGSGVSATFLNTKQTNGKICSIFKLPEGGKIALSGGTGAGGGSKTISVASGNSSYQKQCTPKGIGGGPKFIIGIQLKSGKGSLVVSNVSFEREK